MVFWGQMVVLCYETAIVLCMCVFEKLQKDFEKVQIAFERVQTAIENPQIGIENMQIVFER